MNATYVGRIEASFLCRKNVLCATRKEGSETSVVKK